MAVLAAFVGCKKPEKILPSGDGLWDIKTSRTVIYHDGVLVSDITETADSLGQIYFGEDGTGWSAYYDHSQRRTFVWEIGDHGNAILSYPTGYPEEVQPLPIIELKKDNLVIQDTTTSQIGTSAPPYVNYVDNTITLERSN